MKNVTLGTIVGGLGGAVSGAAMFGLPTYFSTESTFLGPDSDWAGFAATVGMICGLVPGAVIGFLVGKLNVDKIAGGLIGGGVGLIAFLWIFVRGFDALHADEPYYVGLGSIAVDGIIGVIVGTINIRHGSQSVAAD